MRTLITFIVIIALVIIGVVWYKWSYAPIAQPTNSPGEGTITTLPLQTIVVTGADFTYNPKEIRVKQGDTVKIAFNSVGGLHDWIVDGFNARTARLQSGQSETIEFVASKTGTFEYYCSVGSHRQMGMVGKLIVE